VTQTLSALSASSKRLALVGLAKNTGKTVALAALLRELEASGRRVGVTSVGRDGEQRDVIDSRIEKPLVRLPGGSLVATTDGLLRASGLPHELLERTGMRTPLGEVLIARLRGAGAIEVAGPSAAGDVRAVSDAMLAAGAEQVLIDGAVDRRAACSPDVADGIVISTGAILDHDMSVVVARTKDAVELVRLPNVDGEGEDDRRLRALATNIGLESVLVEEAGVAAPLPPRFALTATAEQVAALLDAHPAARWLLLAGALPERSLDHLAHAARRRRLRLVVVVADPTKVFLAGRAPGWYDAHGIVLRALRATELRAITVNPVAPLSHRFDSAELTALLRAEIAHVPIFDVLDPDYAELAGPA
jgi:hypothetical protein